MALAAGAELLSGVSDMDMIVTQVVFSGGVAVDLVVSTWVQQLLGITVSP